MFETLNKKGRKTKSCHKLVDLGRPNGFKMDVYSGFHLPHPFPRVALEAEMAVPEPIPKQNPVEPFPVIVYILIDFEPI